jgi:hypothetical protein
MTPATGRARTPQGSRGDNTREASENFGLDDRCISRVNDANDVGNKRKVNSELDVPSLMTSFRDVVTLFLNVFFTVSGNS